MQSSYNSPRGEVMKKKYGWVSGTLTGLAFLLGLFVFAGALVITRNADHAEHIAQRPPIPTVYHAYFLGDTVVSDVLDNPDLSSDAHVETAKYDVQVPIGYGGDTPLPSEPCRLVPEGYLTQLGVYDERPDDDIIDGVIAVYMLPADAVVKPGECQSKLVVMVKPEYMFFG